MSEETKITVALRKAVHDGNGEQTKSLSFREPTAADIERCGLPVTINPLNDGPQIRFEHREMTAMMVALASVPPSSIRSMDPRDWTTIAWQLAPFFIPDLGATPSSTPTS
jgi:hypothetical protein